MSTAPPIASMPTGPGGFPRRAIVGAAERCGRVAERPGIAQLVFEVRRRHERDFQELDVREALQLLQDGPLHVRPDVQAHPQLAAEQLREMARDARREVVVLRRDETVACQDDVSRLDEPRLLRDGQFGDVALVGESRQVRPAVAEEAQPTRLSRPRDPVDLGPRVVVVAQVEHLVLAGQGIEATQHVGSFPLSAVSAISTL
jgi:hypothetical protein